jgi:putative ABC transport system permease protein
MPPRLFRRLRTLLRRSAVKDDIRREIDFHIDMETDLRVKRGMSPEEARRTALRDFGGVGRYREEVADTRGITLWDSVSQDVRFALRTLRRWPGYAIGTIVTLALGIGANTAIFSVVNDVLLAPLPYRDGHQLVRILQTASRPSPGETGVSIKEMREYRDSLHAVRDVVEYHGMSFILLNHGEPDRVNTGVVSAHFFDMFGVRPILGRAFTDKDDDLGAEPVVLLSHAYWTSKFGGDPAVVGRSVEMNDKPHTIVGVLPPIPQYPRENDVYMPTSACPFRADAEATAMPKNRRAFSGLRVFGRLQDGQTVEGASAEVSAVAQRFATDHPKDYDAQLTQFSGRAVGLNDEMIRDARPILLALLATTGLVLLIACANVANLTLSRMARRDREIALRVALGAGRGRLLRQLLTESTLLSLAGGVIGLGFAWLTSGMLASFAARFTPRVVDPSIDVRVLLFTLLVSVATGIAFGIIPALSAQPALSSSLKEGGAQTGDGRRGRRIRSVLVVAQVMVCFALLTGAGLFIESVHRLANVDLGFRPDRVLTAEVFNNWSRRADNPAFIRIYTGILERLQATPGVLSAAVTNAVPLSNITPAQQTIRIEGLAVADPKLLPLADRNVASEQYFDVLGVRPLRGRVFTSSDHLEAPRVAVINQTMAKLWGDRDPLGGRFKVETPAGTAPWVTVVGIVGDFRQYGVDQQALAQYYTPFLQAPGIGARVLVRTDGDPMALVPALKSAVHSVHPDIPVEGIETLQSLREGKLASPGLTASLLVVFAALALVITLAGIAAVIGTSVSQRVREFGVRLALGATRGSVLLMVLRQGLALVAVGLAGGALAAMLFGRALTSYLYQTKPTDPLVYAVVASLFLIAAAVACLGPARRATSIDPLVALKSE